MHWVIRALWKIGDDVRDSDFPSFLDKESIHCLIEIARLNKDLEENCKKNNLLGYFPGSDDFSYLEIGGDGLNSNNISDMPI